MAVITYIAPFYFTVPLKRLVSGGKGGNSGSKVEGEVYEEYEGARLHFIKVRSMNWNYLYLKIGLTYIKVRSLIFYALQLTFYT